MKFIYEALKKASVTTQYKSTAFKNDVLIIPYKKSKRGARLKNFICKKGKFH